MGSGIGRIISQVSPQAWEEVPGVVKSLDRNAMSYVVTVRGIDVGPLWSVNAQVHPVGATVTILFRGGVAIGLVP